MVNSDPLPSSIFILNFFKKSIYSYYFFSFIFIYSIERRSETERWRKREIFHLTSKWLQLPGLSQVEARSQNSFRVSHTGGRGMTPCFPARHINRELEQKWRGWDSVDPEISRDILTHCATAHIPSVTAKQTPATLSLHPSLLQ